MKQDKHNNWWCMKYWEKALPDNDGNCSMCGAVMQGFTRQEIIELEIFFEQMAEKRCIRSFDPKQWLMPDEKEVYEQVKN